MKKSKWISGMALVCGLAGLMSWILRWRLLSTGGDEKGLLIPGGFPQTVSTIITVLVILATASALWQHRQVKIKVYGSPAATAIRILVFGVAAVSFWQMSLLGKAAAIAAVAAAAVAVVGLLNKRVPQAVEDIPATLFFMLGLLSCYRIWSAEPEIQRYFYRLTALVSLMMATYHRSAMAAGLSKGLWFLGSSFLGIYCSFAAAADPGFTVLFLTLGLWAMTQLDTVREAA